MTTDDTPELLQGGWFSTTDMKLAVSLLSAGFTLKPGGECTRILRDGKESFTWHLETTNASGEHIAAFLKEWETPVESVAPIADPMTCFRVAREAMLGRHWLLTESHRVPAQNLRERDGKRLLYTPKLRPEDRAYLARIAS